MADDNSIGSLMVRSSIKKDWHILWTVPDGQETKKKCVMIGKLGIFTGVFVGTVQHIMRPGHRSLVRSGYLALPHVAAIVGYGFVTNASGELRGQDDPINHAIGGAAAGAVYGLAHGTFLRTALMMPALAGMGYLLKESMYYYKKYPGVPKLQQDYFFLGQRSRKPANLD